MKKIFALFGFVFTLPAFLAALEIVTAAPEDGATVPLLNAAQKAFVTMPRKERIKFFADAEKRKKLKEAGYYPLPVKFAWKSDASDKAEFHVLVAKNADFSDARIVPGKSGAAQIDNLEIGRTYYWQVEAREPGAAPVRSKVKRFSTEDRAPRLLRFPDVPNVRDLGGRKTRNGMYVRQNRIFRTAGMNNNARKIAVKNEADLFRAFPDYREILPFYQGLKKRLDADPKSVRVVPYSLGGKWTVFKTGKSDLTADEMQILTKLGAIPKKLFGAEPAVVEASTRGRVELPLPGKTAVLMQEFSAPADGVMQVATGGDWYWNVRVNGRLVYSRMQGNGKAATTSNYHYFIPVRRGVNLMVVVLKGGSKKMMWCCGKRRKQELVRNVDATVSSLRSEPGGFEKGKSRVTPEGRAIFLGQFGVRSDIDLRSDRECWGMTGSPLGPTVKWFHISSSAYAGMQTDGGRAQFAKVFRVFLDEKNYPVVFHCIAGQDRTGAVAFILNGLLGVDVDELYLDWEVTGFWNPNVKFNHKDRFDRLIAGFEKLPGNDLYEKIENYVLGCGFKAEDIAHFRELMLEKR